MSEPDTALPVIEETLSVARREHVVGRVRVETVTETVEETVTADLESSSVEIERIPVGKEIEAVPDVRVEGDVTIIPVIEEVVVVEKRLVLREEIRVTRIRASRTVEAPVELRRQRAIVTRERAEPSGADPNPKENAMSDFAGTRHLTAFFDTREDADRAVSRLRAAGLTEADIRVAGGEDYGSRLESRDTGGFWDSIADFFFPTEERDTYAEGLRRGGYIVTVGAIPAGRFDEAVDILDEEGSIDLDERSASWRAEGWGAAPDAEADMLTGADAGVATTPERLGMAATAPGVGVEAGGEPGMRAAATGFDAGPAEAGHAGRDEVIPVVEERLRVGKRDASLGRVRVRSYVVEEPVSEEVRLRSEQVEIERRPVDRPLEATDDAFVDRTIEAEERAEEAVVDKEARVTEEIGLRRTADERTETISDTVRHTEVEVEDDRDIARRDPKPGM
ncbi:DUF2382 domain-containing protein [Amaricoccus solimangrovi]|nr:DUF2382 domain-containing protein [Amaricoccus solimangrovi]